MEKQLQFVPFSSALDGGFWHKLTRLKLDVYCLDDKPQNIHGYFSNGNPVGLPCQANVDYTSFDASPKIPPRCFPTHGVLRNTNTIDDFKSCDKKLIMEQESEKLWGDIVSGRAIQDSSLLAKFYLLTFADLKKYHYYYWFAFPALCVPDKVTVLSDAIPLESRFTSSQIESLLQGYSAVCLDQKCGFFLIGEDNTGDLRVVDLRDFESLRQTCKNIIFCMCDPCTLETYPGWPLRNLVALISFHWANILNNELEVLCFRDRFKDGKRSVSHSIVFRLHVPSTNPTNVPPKCVGWEKNERQKLGPRMVNLSASMDPSKLAESAVDLNLKLMRWRLLPQLDLEKISTTRCLLLGSGTLGCNVARSLMAWGVKNITMVDNGKISYSNPVRQSLFVFEDSQHGGQPKAETAAKALRKIFPGVNAVGVALSVPMPGHVVSEGLVEQTRKEVEKLEELVDSHDVIFLLMDTRESRWLPTLLGAAKGKIVMNAALGFDTFLVVRHGMKTDSDPMETAPSTGASAFLNPIPGNELGCYFCNDVVAPGDSTRDRTLDQQCTVSRPGMSMLTSALVVELFVALLTHPQGGFASADTSAKEEHLMKDVESPLGLVPHQIRGFLSRFHNLLPASRAFDKCTACSHVVIESYRKDGFKFLLNVFNEPRYLEDLTGLTQLYSETLDDQVWELDDDEDM